MRLRDEFGFHQMSKHESVRGGLDGLVFVLESIGKPGDSRPIVPERRPDDGEKLRDADFSPIGRPRSWTDRGTSFVLTSTIGAIVDLLKLVTMGRR